MSGKIFAASLYKHYTSNKNEFDLLKDIVGNWMQSIEAKLEIFGVSTNLKFLVFQVDARNHSDKILQPLLKHQ